MADPLKTVNEFQNAWFEAWAAATRNTCQVWEHLLKLQQNFLHHVEKHHRDHIEIATGAALTDKYGKRAHDIDPERDV